jgi:hypothetical protein
MHRQRRLQTTAYVEALDDVTDQDRQAAFDRGFALSTAPAYRLSKCRGVLLYDSSIISPTHCHNLKYGF